MRLKRLIPTNLVFAPIGIFLLLVACGGPNEVPPGRHSRPNVLLISLDTLRADSLGCYGYERNTSPFLDELASHGILFENAFANSHSTGTSHTTILSGLYQETHRVHYDPLEYGKAWTVPPDISLISEIFQGNGYFTIGVTEGGYVGRAFGFARGFDLFQDEQARDIGSSARTLIDFVREADKEGKPLFLFFHTYQVHGLYRSPRSYAQTFGAPVELPGDGDIWQRVDRILRENTDNVSALDSRISLDLKRLYDNAIRYSDDVLRNLFQELDQFGFFDQWLMVVTSDHGEEFGEHGGLQHRGMLFEELVRIPLIIAGNRITDGSRGKDLVGSIDVAPTVLEYCGIDVPLKMPGKNLLTDSSSREFIFMQYGNIAYALRGHRWKFIHAIPLHEHASLNQPFKKMLFDLESDPKEIRNLAGERVGLVDQLDTRLREFRAGLDPGEAVPTRTLSEREREKLRSLGYIK